MKELTADEHAQLINSIRQGAVLLGIDRPFARRFYTDTPLSVMKENTGEERYLEKGLVWLAFLGGPLTLLSSGILSISVLKWWDILFIPFAAITWFIYHASSSRGTARLWPVSLLLVTTYIVYSLSVVQRSLALLAMIFLFALWCSRFLYCGSAFFLRAFVMGNWRAFNFAKDGIAVRFGGDG